MRARRNAALVFAAATLAFAAAPRSAPVPALRAPAYTREDMESALVQGERWRFVYGTRDPAAAAALKARAQALAARFGGDSSAVIADRAAKTEDLTAGPVCLIGNADENDWTRRLAPALPVQFTAGGFRWFGRDYTRPGDGIHLVYPNPLAPRRFLLLVAANTPDAPARGGGMMFGGDDWRITRDGELLRSGVFAQTPRPWRYDPSLDRDREEEARRFAASLKRETVGGLALAAPPDLPGLERTRDAAAGLLQSLAPLGLGRAGTPPVSLTLYRSLEEKGALTRITRPEHVSGRAAHVAPAAGRTAADLWSVAAARLVALGAAPDSPWLEPAGVALAGRLEGEPLARAVGRLYYARILPSPEDAARAPAAWRSPLVRVPARALLARAALEVGGARALLGVLAANPPGTLDSLCRRARLDRARVSRRYAALADSLGRAARPDPARTPRLWRPADGFQRGVCLAHAVSLEHGYLSAECARELASLQRLGVGWVSVSPFGYMPPGSPEILPSAEGGPEEESDEAVCEAGARARALGMRVWLAPHLWTRGWVGDLRFGPAGWERFFERYREFLIHYALLAEREGFDGLVVGHELAGATASFPDRWRALIGESRRIYRGTLTYDANWGDEVRSVGFWDALDLIGVSFYEPIATSPTTDVGRLAAGAGRALANLEAIAKRAHRPVVLLEVGYGANPDAPVHPWQERPGPVDLETQRACYEAVTRALGNADWVAGLFWWKWFSGGAGTAGTRATDAGYSPRGKPAEQEVKRAFAAWRTRAVRVP